TFIGVVVGSYYSPDISLIWDYSHDKVKHMIAYFSLTLMACATCYRFNWSKKIVIIIFMLGVFIELTQPFAGRSASFQDLLANSLGIALGALVASWCGFRIQFKGNSRKNPKESMTREAIPSDLPLRF
ncbi:MAG: VanZ family protein, partial [Hyphomicrobiales bacterium]